ncbi:MAG TPA: iron uptake transporter deferrochelatase/peroxidase subunit [Solirubrobacteraceae bacterium]|nr:iron uptake transporter deferrochelatase/peroxidase subunit [Solirubrobacteraceae bacterium]
MSSSSVPDDGARQSGITRRAVVSGALAMGIGAGLDQVIAKRPARTTVTHGAGAGAEPLKTPGESARAEQSASFYGTHQAGITTLAQEYMSFATFDLMTGAVEDLRAMLERWTAAAASLTVGRPYEPTPQRAGQPPLDPGEATDLPPAQLTITVGFGPSLFRKDGIDRFRLAGRKPSVLNPLPPFAGDQVLEDISGGDLCVQACANDPQVAFHAVHLLAKLAAGVARIRWSQVGFGRTASTSRIQVTTRNLMGFKDGTDNIRSEEQAVLERFVWVQPGDGPDWMAGGSYLVARRIRILLDVWDATTLEEQERTIGRDKRSGAPLGRAREYDRVDLQATDASGRLAIPANAHIRLANPHNNDGQRILRRGYSYAEPVQPGSDQLDAGLFFISFQRDPERQFIPLQARLAALDALNRHTRVTSSSIFGCPPGASEGGFLGEALLAGV